MTTNHVDLTRHALADGAYAAVCRDRLERDGALVLPGFATATTVEAIVAQSAPRESDAFYAGTTHNVYLTPPSPEFADDHPRNRQVVSSKGLIADDEIPPDSPLREIYEDPSFRSFLCRVFDIEAIHPYADELSSINVHFAAAGRELGWHFDNSSFAVTMLLQAPDGGGRFDYVPGIRDTGEDDGSFERIGNVLNGHEAFRTLDFDAGDLVLFRGRNALHRVTPTVGDTTRMLVVFAFNDRPGVALSASALATFYGRTA